MTLPYATSLVAFCSLLLSSLAAAAEPAAGDVVDKKLATDEYGDKCSWYDIRLLGVEGCGWSEADLAHPFDRLPAKAEKVVREPVWNLSLHSAGMYVRFVTDATRISARWKLRNSSLAMPHMPATGVSGVDLYARMDDGQLRWLACGQPNAQTNQKRLTDGLAPGKREYWLYLPLYNGVDEVQIGVSADALLAKAPPWPAERAKPICFYGTSITQGGCASRPGMAYAAILGRRLDRPTINLGFSGNGRMDPEVASLLAELDPAVYVIDCVPNMGAADVASRTEPLVQRIRKARPQTPILLVEDRTYANAPLLAALEQRHQASRQALRSAYEALAASGIKNLYYLEGEKLLGDDREDTVDGSHPTDLGFMRMADALGAALQPLVVPPSGGRPLTK